MVIGIDYKCIGVQQRQRQRQRQKERKRDKKRKKEKKGKKRERETGRERKRTSGKGNSKKRKNGERDENQKFVISQENINSWKKIKTLIKLAKRIGGFSTLNSLPFLTLILIQIIYW